MKLERSIQIAVVAHEGQVDKAGLPYILHPLSVMQRVREKVGIQADYLSAAVLHDVPEDCGPVWTLDALKAEGLAPHVVEAIDSVTKRKGECYPDFVRRSKANTIGKIVKLADVQDNMSRMSARQYNARWAQKITMKYSVALAILNDDNEWLDNNRDLVIAMESL